jgi:diguanylate cyclase (GGDEF)-like protein
MLDATDPTRIVVLDDSLSNLAILKGLARASARPDAPAGHGDPASASGSAFVEVHPFTEPFAALAWLRDHVADLVITDFVMPGLDGAGFVERLRQEARDRSVPVVVVTAYDDRERRVHCLKVGATDFLYYPFDVDEAVARIRNLALMGRQQRAIRDQAAALAHDLDESEAAQQRFVRDSSARLAHVIDGVPALISARDLQGRVVFRNALHARAARPEAEGNGPRDDQGLDQRVIETGAALPGFEETVVGPTGHEVVLLTSKTPLRDGDGRLAGVLTTSVDITQRKRAERKLRSLARHDGLTGLLNREAFCDELARAVARGRRSDRGLALHYVDVDLVKRASDGNGYQVGLHLLRAVASRLTGVAGEGAVVGRLGTDDFAVIQTGSPTGAMASAFAERVLRALEPAYGVDGLTVEAKPSIGTAVYPGTATNPAELLHSADLATYRARLAGQRTVCLAGGGEDCPDRPDVEAELRACVERGALARFSLHFQPQADLRTGEIVGADALPHWWRRRKAVFGFGTWLPAVERTGLALPLGDWFVQAACAQAVQWWRQGLAVPRVGLPVFPSQAQREGFAARLLALLAAHGLPPSMLAVNLTGDTLADAGSSLLADLTRLRAAGVRVVCDDYGVVHLPASVLLRASVDGIRIDPTLVQRLDTDEEAVEILCAAVALGRTIGADVAASGVETEAQRDILTGAGCHVLQGRLIGLVEHGESFALSVLQSRPVSGVGAPAAPGAS